MYSLETLYLFGNPIVNQNPALAKIEGNQVQLRKALEQYFGGGSSPSITSSSFGGSGAVGGLASNFQHGMSLQSNPVPSASFGKSYGAASTNSATLGSGVLAPSVSSASFLQSDINDPAALRKKIADLEAENKRLKESDIGSKGSSTLRAGNPTGDKDWMNFGGSALERPTTASTTQQVKSLQEELKYEKKEKKHMIDEIENLKKELQKSNFSAFTQSSSSISVSAGRLPQVPGVREISLEDIVIGEQIS